MILIFPDDVDTDLLRLLAAKAMNPKPANKKGDSLKRPKRSTSVSDFSWVWFLFLLQYLVTGVIRTCMCSIGKSSCYACIQTKLMYFTIYEDEHPYFNCSTSFINQKALQKSFSLPHNLKSITDKPHAFIQDLPLDNRPVMFKLVIQSLTSLRSKLYLFSQSDSKGQIQFYSTWHDNFWVSNAIFPCCEVFSSP